MLWKFILLLSHYGAKKTSYLLITSLFLFIRKVRSKNRIKKALDIRTNVLYIKFRRFDICIKLTSLDYILIILKKN